MASKFAKQFQIPPEFPDIMRDFAREVLRNQPEDINEFAVKYFDCLATGGQVKAPSMEEIAAEIAPQMGDVEALIRDLFAKYDTDVSGTLEPREFKKLVQDVQNKLGFPEDEVYRFLAEADMNTNGRIEYEEFIPLALQIIQGIYAKQQLAEHMEEVTRHAQELLVHGMSRAELTEMIAVIFEKVDRDKSGTLCMDEFVQGLSAMELGLTRREINTVMFQVDQNQDGSIDYREFVPLAFDLLSKLTSMRLLEIEMQTDELATYLTELFKSADVEMTGVVSVEDMLDLLHQAGLGLSLMQIYVVISEAELDNKGRIPYAKFVPKAVGLIRSMSSFEHGMHTGNDTSAEDEEKFYSYLEEAMPGAESVATAHFAELLEKSGLLSPGELNAAKLYLNRYGDEAPAQDAKKDVWHLVKSKRRHLSL